jgi:hypothetical protein
MEKQILTFALERETKNTIRYQEDANSKPPAIGTLYVQKWLLGKEPPKALTITIEDTDTRTALT